MNCLGAYELGQVACSNHEAICCKTLTFKCYDWIANIKVIQIAQVDEMTAVGFEPTPLRTGALSQRLRPLGQTVLLRIPLLSNHG